MRTNIVIDGELMAAALKTSSLGTKREVVEAALRLLVRRKRQEAIRAAGPAHWSGARAAPDATGSGGDSRAALCSTGGRARRPDTTDKRIGGDGTMAGDDVRRFGPGETLFAEGDPSTEVLRIRSGEVEVLKEIEGGGVVLGRLAAGEFVGEMGVIQDRPRNATVRAVGEVTAEAIPKDAFLGRISQDSATAFQLLVRLSERLRRADLQLAQAAAGAAAGLPAAAADRVPVAGHIEPAPAAETIRIVAGSEAMAAELPRDGLDVYRFPFAVGRRPAPGEATPLLAVDLQLPDERPYRLSRAHFAIRRHGRGYVVSDLGSALGTAVNGKFLGHFFPSDVIDLRVGENEIVAGGADSPFAFKVLVEAA